MLPPQPHRKRVHHFNVPGHVHELTFSCYRRMPLLTSDGWRASLSGSIDRANQRHGFQLIAFVYMPEHVHLIVFPRDPAAKIDRLLFAIKHPFSFRVKQDLVKHNDPLLRRLTIRERPGKEAFRFWQEGGGYDRNLQSLENTRVAIDYVHHNPVRRGLCDSPEKWKWSSWPYYHNPDAYGGADLPTIHGFPV